ncbi:PREDICTED: uncharacterized protein LOC101813600 [Ficedula albicollis]|uniref:uncharacterized protein LOC101813600 n=1 Tax=Ficedula albicollis TaxID=59894 RepID=UPI0007AD83B8|nr:PREDICTED: uncharacterized protein LOC101813600 [Ficedula albicollis]
MGWGEGSPQAPVELTRTLLTLYSGVTPGLLRLYSRVTPGLLRLYSTAAQAQLCGHTCPTPALLHDYSASSRSSASTLDYSEVTPRLLQGYSKVTPSFLSASVEVAQDSLPARILLWSYSRAGRGLYSALTLKFLSPCLELTPGFLLEILTPSLLRVYSALEALGTHSSLTHAAPPSGLAQLPPVLFPLLWRCSHFTPGWILFAFAPRLLRRYSALLREAQPLLRAYSASTQSLLGLYSELTRPLLRAYSASTQSLLGLYSELTRRLLSLYSEVTQPRIWTHSTLLR